ncbi:hypothetical protein FRC01_002122 [Tulasnella sp. 417]|nr:hypothetical protein FRC01_002122 [Tulasnella sp. 417]
MVGVNGTSPAFLHFGGEQELNDLWATWARSSPTIRAPRSEKCTRIWASALKATPHNNTVDSDSYKKTINDPTPGSVVTIFTPDTTRHPIAILKYALERKIHVLVTKPATKLLEHHQDFIAFA